jgi:hypothetical protein
MPVANGAEASRVFKNRKRRFGSWFLGIAFSLVALVNGLDLAQLRVSTNEDIFGATSFGVVFAVSVAVIFRSPWVATAQIKHSQLIYRSLFRTRRIQLSQIKQIKVETHLKLGFMPVTTPHVTLNDGRSIWLEEFTGSSVSEGNLVANDLVAEVNHYLIR